MDFNKLIDRISSKVSQKYLIILIVILLIAITAVICLYLGRNNITGPDQSIASSTEKVAEKPPMVVIDPGHGGWEPGAENGKIQEKDITLSISLEVEKILKEKNIDYYMIRTDDSYVSLEDRAKIANDKKSKLFISIHNNSFTDASQGGILTTYNPNSTLGKRIAKIMQSKIKELGMRNRDIMPRPNLYVLRHTEMPSLLLEIGFMSNKKDLKLLTDTNFQQKCAQQIVSGIEQILTECITDEEENSAVD